MQSTKRKQVSASDLIANAKTGAHKNRATFSNEVEALAELRKICEHNDTNPSAKVTARDTIAMLRSAHGWTGQTCTTLSEVCRRSLGRKSFSSK
jgi:hypothetical protein